MKEETQIENVHFLEYAIKRVAIASGLSDEHAQRIAKPIAFAHRQGKLNQGLGVYECIDIVLNIGSMDPKATPKLVNEGPAFAVFDGQCSSGYYTVSLMAEKAIELARETGIAIVFGGNHFDAGSFAYYVHLAYQQDMVGIASNNTVPLAAPYGGMENKLSCPPFDAIIPSGEQAPIWTSIKFAEFYDADIAEAAIHNKPMKGKWLIDPVTGDVSDDVKPYAKPIPGYGRLWDYTCAGQIETPRTYTLNMWNEGMTAIINPLGIPSTELPTIEDVESGDLRPTVGGSYFICIDPSRFGDIEKVKQRADAFIEQISGTKPRPDHKIRIPGETGYQSLKEDNPNVEVLTNHWQPFFENIAGRYGLTEAGLRDDFANLTE